MPDFPQNPDDVAGDMDDPFAGELDHEDNFGAMKSVYDKAAQDILAFISANPKSTRYHRLWNSIDHSDVPEWLDYFNEGGVYITDWQGQDHVVAFSNGIGYLIDSLTAQKITQFKLSI